jgi:hypothetical protein
MLGLKKTQRSERRPGGKQYPAPQLSGTLPVSVEQPPFPSTPEDPWGLARRELERSRRYGHPLALVRVVPITARHDTASPEASPVRLGRRTRVGRAGRDAAAELVLALRDTLRDIDAVWTDRRGVFLLLPESDVEAGRSLVSRLRGGEQPFLTAEDDVRVGAFPADGLTLDALIAAVTRPVPAPALPVAAREPEHDGAEMPAGHRRRRLTLGTRAEGRHAAAETIADQSG